MRGTGLAELCPTAPQAFTLRSGINTPVPNPVCAVTSHTVQHRSNTDWDSGLVFYLCHKHAVHNWADVVGGTDWMGLPSPLQAAWQRQEGQTQ